MGFRCGFLGLLHMDVFLQRLEQARPARASLLAHDSRQTLGTIVVLC
jgi:hypothetical protein